MIGRRELIGKISKETGISQTIIREVLGGLHVVVLESLARGEEVHILNGVIMGGKYRSLTYSNFGKGGSKVASGIRLYTKYGQAFKDNVNSLYTGDKDQHNEAPF